MKKRTLLTLFSLIFIFQKCSYPKNYRIVNEIILKNEKIAILKNRNAEVMLVQFTGNKDPVNVSMKRKLENDTNYELDGVQTVGNYTIIELFLRQEGVNSAMGFLFSCDSNKNFNYIDVSEIDSSRYVEDIEKMEINPKENRIHVSLYSFNPKGRYFTSVDSCRSWQLDTLRKARR